MFRKLFLGTGMIDKEDQMKDFSHGHYKADERKKIAKGRKKAKSAKAARKKNRN